MRSFLLSGVAAASLLIGAGAHATTISIGLQETGVNSGMISTVATDSALPGSAVFAGSYGTFILNTVTAQGSPFLPQGSLSTTSIQTSSTTAGTITIYITEQGLTSPTGLSSFLSSFTSNTFSGLASSVVESTLYSNSNALYAGTQLAATTFSSIGTSTNTTTANLTGTYSETVEYVVTVGAGPSNVNDTINLTASVPEPASMAILGVGLAGIGLIRRRR